MIKTLENLEIYQQIDIWKYEQILCEAGQLWRLILSPQVWPLSQNQRSPNLTKKIFWHEILSAECSMWKRKWEERKIKSNKLVSSVSPRNLYSQIVQNPMNQLKKFVKLSNFGKVPFIYYVSTCINSTKLNLTSKFLKLVFFVKTKEFLFQHEYLTKFSCFK